MKKTLVALSLLVLFPISAYAETESSTVSDNAAVASTEQSAPIQDQSADNTVVDSSAPADATMASGTENSETKDVQKAQDKTVDQIEKETGVKKAATLSGMNRIPIRFVRC